MVQLQNQFTQAPEKGYLDLRMNPTTIPCCVDSSQVTALVPGQAVKMVDSAGGVPKVVALAADTDKIFGFVASSIKDQKFSAGSAVEIAAEGNVIYLQSSAAIARGAKVMVVITGEKVATATNGKSCAGFAFDKATGADQLVRIYLQPFSSAAIAGEAADVGASAFTPALPVAATIGATFDQTEVKAALLLKADNADLETLRTEVAAKIDGYRTALRAAGLMA